MSEKAIEEIMEYDGKPIRICRGTIKRQLGLNNTWFNNKRLIKTHQFIAIEEEDITSYRIRKIRWAINEMLEDEQSITPYKVQLYAGFGGGKTDVRTLVEKEIDNIE